MFKTIVLLAIVAIALTIISIMIFPSALISDAIRVIPDDSGDNSPDDPDYPNDPGITGRAASGGSSSGGSGGGSSPGGTTVTDPETGCTLYYTPYSALDFISEQTCNEQEGEICTDKTVFCSITTNNLDQELSGTFEILFKFFEEDNLGNILYTTSSSFFLEPGEGHVFEGEYNTQSQGVEGEANKELTCFYEVLNSPYEEVCP